MPAAEKLPSNIGGDISNVTTFRAVSRHPAFLSVALALITFLVFLPVAWNDFVNYDDPDYVTANAHVQQGIAWNSILWAFTTGHASNWHPLTWLFHMADWHVFGGRAGAQHLVSLAFHIANTVLLFLILKKMTGATWRSAIVAALFALHPLHVESVAWISERKDVLSAFFWMLTLWAYLGYASRRSESGTHSSVSKILPSCFYLLSLTFFVLGLMSKPMMVTLPFVLLLLDYWPLGRWPRSVSEPGSIWSKFPNQLAKRALVIEKLPFFILTIVSSYITFVVQRKGGAVSTSISLDDRFANALVSYVRYLGKTIWPQKLSVLYPHPGHWPASSIIMAPAFLVLISATVLFFWRKRPYLAVGWFWFVGTLVPVIGLIQVGVQSMADRYTYIPLIGLFILLVWLIADLLEAQERLHACPGTWVRAGAFAIGAALLICALLTSKQLQYWRNSEALFSHAVQITERNYLAYNNLGFYFAHRGKPLEAMENYRKALEINPAYEDALNNMGYALAGQKKPLEALPYYQAALSVRPNHVEVHNNLGNALAELGQIDQAMEHYKIVLAQRPDHVDAHNNLGIALAMKGLLEEGMTHFREAIRLKPGDASAHSNLGNALAAQHKFNEAVQEYEQSLRLRPNDAQANNNLGNVLAEQGLLTESIVRYERAIQLNADNPEAHFNLAMALARLGRRPEAIVHVKEAVRLKPDYGQAKEQLDRLMKAE
jgi:protein O-mannosyl-transferase